MRLTRMIFVVALSACGSFPVLDENISDSARKAPYPALTPVGPLLAKSSQTTSLDDEGFGPRVADLNARADALRDPVIDGNTRSTLQAGIDSTALQ